MHDVIELMRERLNYDHDTGTLTYSSKAKGNKRAGDKVGCLDRHGYIKVMFQGKMYFAHRIVWMMLKGRTPNGLLDHLNGDKLDNRIENLRETNHSGNGANSDAPHGQSRVRGTTRLRDGRFQAGITCNGKRIHLGVHETQDQARRAYEAASIRLFGEFSPYAQGAAAQEGGA